jgi:ADP-ribose pyrophosphatase YjhB (NUDIX family)
VPKPITPLVGCDVFVLNENKEVLLIQRVHSKFWALPGGFHDLGETPKACAERECFEETGFHVTATEVLGIYSSNCYEYKNYQWKDNEITHLLFKAQLEGGESTPSAETPQVGWFKENELPAIFDGHAVRIQQGFKHHRDSFTKPHFE